MIYPTLIATGNYLDTANGGTNNALQINRGTVIFNDGSDADSDFRVESDSNTHMLFIDSSANAIGINTAAPAEALHVDGSIKHSTK